jgi:ABC-type Fe3+ transport system permease subunit
MAAVFALVFLFAFASFGLMIGIAGPSFGTVLATLCFGTLAAGVFYGLFRMARTWEADH